MKKQSYVNNIKQIYFRAVCRLKQSTTEQKC